MTRRDTIISAALINAGLLVVLFVCALSIDESSQAASQVSEMEPAVHVATQTQSAPAASAPVTLPQVEEIPLGSSAPVSQELPVLKKTAAPSVFEIEVQKGDRVDKLAAKYSMSVEELLQLNNLQTTQLIVGQKLKVTQGSAGKTSIETLAVDNAPKTVKEPAKVQSSKEPVKATSPSKASPKVQQSSTLDETIQYHYVQKGESPWIIAKKYGLSVEKLLKLNNLDEATARRLREGDRLRVR